MLRREARSPMFWVFWLIGATLLAFIALPLLALLLHPTLGDLPQVAAMADQHLYIEKEIIADRTKTHVKSLFGAERINEVARMLAGTDITELSLAHAKELLELANTEKNKA